MQMKWHYLNSRYSTFQNRKYSSENNFVMMNFVEKQRVENAQSMSWRKYNRYFTKTCTKLNRNQIFDMFIKIFDTGGFF